MYCRKSIFLLFTLSLSLSPASLDTIVSFVSAISVNLTGITKAVSEANLTLATIQSRDFTTVALRTNATLQEAVALLVSIEALYEEAERTNRSTNLLIERVWDMTTPLLQLRYIEAMVGGALQNATEINNVTKNLLGEIKVDHLCRD